MNKIALISDIQGNLTALQYVLKQIACEQINDIICLGDVASGAYPHEVVSLLREHNIRTVKGNMDDAILNPHRHEDADTNTERYDDIDQWCSKQLTEADKAFMRSFAPMLRVQLDDDNQLLCFHGSPYSYNDVLDESTPEDTLRLQIDGYAETMMATGHIHHPFLRMYQDTTILCPGSVGLPRQRQDKHPCHAEYAILDWVDGRAHFEFRQVKFPVEEFKKGILDSGMPHAHWFLSLWAV